jgi:hypothetical protein
MQFLENWLIPHRSSVFGTLSSVPNLSWLNMTTYPFLGEHALCQSGPTLGSRDWTVTLPRLETLHLNIPAHPVLSDGQHGVQRFMTTVRMPMLRDLHIACGTVFARNVLDSWKSLKDALQSLPSPLTSLKICWTWTRGLDDEALWVRMSERAVYSML